MKNHIIAHEWKIIEDGFKPELNRVSESIFSLGNGHMGQRGNFEETYSGDTLQGNYIAGVYYPDKTRVGWWKNGYPAYFAKVLNATNWIRIQVFINDVELDLNSCKVLNFSRILDMKSGLLERVFTVETPQGIQAKIVAYRFNSMADEEIGAINYNISLLNSDAEIRIASIIDGDVRNEDSNYDEYFWNPINHEVHNNQGCLTLATKKTDFHVCTGVYNQFLLNGKAIDSNPQAQADEKKLTHSYRHQLKRGEELTLIKLVANLSSQNYPKNQLVKHCREKIAQMATKGWHTLLEEHILAWANKWKESDIIIKGDVKAQQAIRFNIFQLFQTYTGKDDRLNIGPKGFTGEKYGGSTYWDTEAYCVPFFLATAPADVSKNLLMYRYKHLPKAIENAEKLGFKNGAALYPMVTMNGEECHNEWEITFEEIHRNGAIAFAIYNYTRYTGDNSYLADYGIEVLIGIARFWAQRVNWSESKQLYVMLGVTGPNEYENNVNNNWYTNTIAVWCLNYTLQTIETLRQENKLASIIQKTKLNDAELANWKDIAAKMYLPINHDLGIFLQQDGYLDKEQVLVADLPLLDRPLNQKWSWDRILRSCFIKQADVLQGLYFFEDQFDMASIERNFDFYEPRTVHESSLSPCVHSILACKLDRIDKAYEMYLRTARLDLDNYNNDTEDGLHITSMAGTWMSVVEGFAGMRIKNDKLYFSPKIPKEWESYAFNIGFRENILKIEVTAHDCLITNLLGPALQVCINNKPVVVS